MKIINPSILETSSRNDMEDLLVRFTWGMDGNGGCWDDDRLDWIMPTTIPYVKRSSKVFDGAYYSSDGP